VELACPLPDVQIIPSTSLRSQTNIFQYGQGWKDVGNLKRPPDTEMGHSMQGDVRNLTITQEDPSRCRFEITANQIEKSRLSSTIRPNNRMHASSAHPQIDVINGAQGAEITGQGLGLNDPFAHKRTFASSMCRACPHRHARRV